MSTDSPSRWKYSYHWLATPEEEQERDSESGMEEEIWQTWRTAETSKRARLTFGVECEYNIAWIKVEDKDPDPEDNRQVYGIIKTETHEMGANLARKKESQGHTAETLRKAGLEAYSKFDRHREEDWLVEHEHTVSALEPEGYEFWAVETSFPPFYYCKDSLLQVNAASQTLANSYRLVCNDSTGL